MPTSTFRTRTRTALRIPVICHRCGNDRPATFHQSFVADGVETTRAFCAECAEALGLGVSVGAFTTADGPPRGPRERFEGLLESIGDWGTREQRLGRLREVLGSYEHFGTTEECAAAAGALEHPRRRRWWGNPPPEFVRAFVEKFGHK